MTLRGLSRRLGKVGSGGCPGGPTGVVVVRPQRVARIDGPACPRCGGRHPLTVAVRRDPDFFRLGPA